MTTVPSSAHPDLAGGRLTIDLGALAENWMLLKKRAGDAECGAVVKANAYGCGIQPVVAMLRRTGCKTFFVAVAEEGIRVRNTAPDARCFVLSGLYKGAAQHFIDAGLIPVLNSTYEIQIWAEACEMVDRRLPCAIHVDTGMNRLGITYHELEALIGNDKVINWLDITTIMTHYACADDIGHPKTTYQRENFLHATYLLPGRERSAANSAATLHQDGHAFDLVRPGIALYGGEAINNIPNPMKPVVKLEGRIVQIRDAAEGQSVGYGASETLKRDSRIAYLSVGYADGYHRSISNSGVPMRSVNGSVQGAYRGVLLPGIGRISMDLMAFDVTDIPENQIGPGSWIELFGPTVALDNVARAAGTIGYELLTGLGHRYARTYLGTDA